MKNKEELEKLNEGFGYNANQYSAGMGAFSGRKIQHAPPEEQEPAQYGPNTTERPPHPAQDLIDKMTGTDAVDMRQQCTNCAKFSEECGCKGNCGNCGGTNGGCDCAMNQDFSLGDMVRVTDKDGGCNGSTGRVVDLPSPTSVTYVVIKPAGGKTPGELVNMPMGHLTIDEKFKL